MRKTIRFSKLFLPAAIFSIVLATAGIVSYFVMGGFNLGVDFRPGLIQEVQFAPTAFNLTWSGRGNATIAFDRSGMYIVNSGVGVEPRTFTFPFSEYGTVGELTNALSEQVEGLSAQLDVPEWVSTQWLVRSAQGNPQLGARPYLVHYLNPQSLEIPIAAVREAVSGLGQTVAVQSLGQPQDRHFMIRVDDRQEKKENGSAAEDVSAEAIFAEDDSVEFADAAFAEDNVVTVAPTERITNVLEEHFGKGEVVVLRSDYVGSRFSKNLSDQAGILIACTLLLVLLYATIRFKFQYAAGAVLGIIHDGIVIVAFVVWSGMEFNTTTIAAILTILGYSTNNTIVVFDRIRENRRLYPDELFINILDRSLTETLNRTIITTVSTMLAVMSLFIFTTGSMQDFALALMIGMLSGVYTTMFIVSGFVSFWEKKKAERSKLGVAQPAK
ncbi:MAG: protein translocase subunit SecF [Treponema sp.]|nr:protein translocase subunit SecF [Treponema sp.]